MPEDVRQPEPLDCRINEDGPVVRDDVPVDRDLEVLAVLPESPAIYGALRDLPQVDAVMSVQIARMQWLSTTREVWRRAYHHDLLVRADADAASAS